MTASNQHPTTGGITTLLTILAWLGPIGALIIAAAANLGVGGAFLYICGAISGSIGLWVVITIISTLRQIEFNTRIHAARATQADGSINGPTQPLDASPVDPSKMSLKDIFRG